MRYFTIIKLKKDGAKMVQSIEKSLTAGIRWQLAQEFKAAQDFGFTRTAQQFQSALHNRLKKAGLPSSYYSIYLKV